MPIIYLKHSLHGTKIANMEAEANADVENGWVVYNPTKQSAKPVNQLAEVAVEAAVEVEVEEVKAEQPEEVKRRRRN